MILSSRSAVSESRDWLRSLARLPAAVKWAMLASLVLGVVLLSWLAVQALDAKSHLEQARGDSVRAKDALLSGDPDEAKRWAENARFNAQQARSATHSGPWAAIAAVPILGSPLKTTQQIADVVLGLSDSVLLPAADLGAGISPENLVDGTRVNLEVLRHEQPALDGLAASAVKLSAQAQDIPAPAYFKPVSQALSELQSQAMRISRLLRYTAIAAELAPSMLGADGARTYLMAFQTNAEARGTGGLVGGLGVVRFDEGVPEVDTLTSNTQLDEAVAQIDLGPEFAKGYGWTNPLTDFRNSNLSAHFPYAAQIWKSMWESQGGVPVDGVIALDPVALSYVLSVVGAVTLPSGEVVSHENVVALTQSIAYERFPITNRAPAGLAPDEADRYNRAYAATLRKNFLQEIASAVVTKMTVPLAQPTRLLDALGRAVSEGRIAIWSAFPHEQEVLEETPLAHHIPDDAAPYAQVVVNNLAGNKMDYYLQREIEYVADDCTNDRRNSTVTVKLSNTATKQHQLPEYVSGAAGIRPELNLKVPSGTMVTSVRVIATKGAELVSVTANGNRTTATTNTERGHPSFEVQVAIPPGESGTLVFRLSEPTSPGQPRIPIQPLIDTVTPAVSVPVCPAK